MSMITTLMKEKILAQAAPGRVFFVMDSDASYVAAIQNLFGPSVNVYASDNTGLSDAVSAAVTGRGDVIYVFPGSYTMAASVNINKEGLKIVGLSSNRKGSNVSFTGASDQDEIFQITEDKVVIEGIRFNLYSTTKDGIRIAESANLFDIEIRDCTFVGGNVGIKQNNVSDAPRLIIEDNVFIGQTTAGILVNASYGRYNKNVFDSIGVAVTAQLDITLDGAPIRWQSAEKNLFLGRNVAVIGLNVDTGGTGYVTLIENRFANCTDDISVGTNTALINNYDEASGGTLLSA